MADVTSSGIRKYLDMNPTVDPLRELARVEALRGQVMGETLRLMSTLMEQKTDHLKRINDLVKELQQLRPPGTNPDETHPGLAGDDFNDPVALAKANSIMDELHAEGVALDQPPGYKDDRSVKFKPGQDRGFKKSTYDDWISELKINIDNLQLTTQQEQSSLQSAVSLFNKVYEVATSLVAKGNQLTDLINQNMRG